MAKTCIQYDDAMDCDKQTCVGCDLFGSHKEIMTPAVCDECHENFLADEATVAESHITKMWCPKCWFKLMGSEYSCAPNYPNDASIEIQMAFACKDCSNEECKSNLI